jgi:hypothetical protein
MSAQLGLSEDGLGSSKPDLRPNRGPLWVNNGLMQLQQDALVFGFALEAMAAGSVQ